MEAQPLLDELPIHDAEATINKQVINQLHGLLPKRAHPIIRLPSFFPTDPPFIAYFKLQAKHDF
jgi:hypothetical protein